MTSLIVDLRHYAITPAYLTHIASEYGGIEVPTNSKHTTEFYTSEHTTEFSFTGPTAPANAKAFRQTLDTCFAKPPPDSGAAI